MKISVPASVSLTGLASVRFVNTEPSLRKTLLSPSKNLKQKVIRQSTNFLSNVSFLDFLGLMPIFLEFTVNYLVNSL